MKNKAITKKLILLIILAILLIPTIKVEAKAEKVWNKELDIYDSTETEIVKVEDGIIIFQIEGSVRDLKNRITKYDFNGNKIWEKENNFGNRIQGVSDGFLVWRNGNIGKFRIAKYDKDGNAVWIKETDFDGGLNGKQEVRVTADNIVEVDDGYIIKWEQSSIMYRNGNNGNGNPHSMAALKIYKNGSISSYTIDYSQFFKFMPKTDNLSTYTRYAKIAGYNISKDGDIIFLTLFAYSDNVGNSWLSFGNPAYDYKYALGIVKYDKNMKYQQTVMKDIDEAHFALYSSYNSSGGFNNIIEINDGYVASGASTVYIDKEGKMQKSINTVSTDMHYLDDNIYLYAIEPTNETLVYNSAIHKYTSNMQLQRSNKLDTFYIAADTKGFGSLYRRAIFYKSGEDVYVIVLNTPVKLVRGSSSVLQTQFYDKDMKYSVTKYRITDEEESNNGIIENIIKNPETDSIIMIIVFVVIIVGVSALSYYFYNKKHKKEK